LTQPIDGVGLSHRVLRELGSRLLPAVALFSVWAGRDKGSSIVVKANDDYAPVNPPSISRRLI
jgi:hypothetical protein